MKKALLLIDVQNDFLPGGALAVPEGDQILPCVCRLLQLPFDRKIASQDWHPQGHVSFVDLWPVHCVAGSRGAELASPLSLTNWDRIIQKGTHPEVDSYSAFFDNAKLYSTELAQYLHQEKIDTLYVAGLATEYCVKFTVLDALQLGFHVYVVQEGCRGVNLHPQDVEHAWKEMERAGAHLVSLSSIEKLWGGSR